MATLYSIPIRMSPKACLDYIADPAKIVPQKDTMRLMTYMQSHAAELANSVGYNGCFANKEMALQQFSACHAMYDSQHKKQGQADAVVTVTVEQYLKMAGDLQSLPQGVCPDSDGLIRIKKSGVQAHHLVFSLDNDDRADPELIRRAWGRFMALPYMQDFYGYANVHHNTENLHLHCVIPNASKRGDRRLSMNSNLLNRMKNDLDHICVDLGLSIIDDPVLAYKYPERAKWIEGLVREGKVRVLIPENADRIKNPTRHQRWMLAKYNAGKVEKCKAQGYGGKFKSPGKNKKQMEIFSAQQDKNEDRVAVETSGMNPGLIETAHKKDVLRYGEKKGVYFGQFICSEPMTPQQHEVFRRRKAYKRLYVHVSYYDGRRQKTQAEVKAEYNHKVLAMRSRPNRELQAQLDAISTCRELNIRVPEDLERRVKEIGNHLGQARRDIEYQRKTLQNGSDLILAIRVYRDTTQTETARREAYRTIASHKCNSNAQMDDALKRYEAAERRLPALVEKEKELNRQYREAVKARESLRVLEYRVARPTPAPEQDKTTSPPPSRKRTYEREM